MSWTSQVRPPTWGRQLAGPSRRFYPATPDSFITAGIFDDVEQIAIAKRLRYVLDYVLRFLAGGIAVSAFAALSDALRPRTLAGLFGAAPSIALATILIALSKQGASFVAVEAKSMSLGALALVAYCGTVCVLLRGYGLSSFAATMAAFLVWFAAAFGTTAVLIGIS
jgi:hypothetical protein